MKTVGQILKTAREGKNYSLEQLSSLTKIDIKYIVALEADDFAKLPSETFAKGFIRNLALRLERKPEELVAVFRRDYRQPHIGNAIPSKRKRPFSFSFLNSQLVLFGVAALVFFVYLGFQFRAILTPPKLDIQRPTPQSVLISPLEIEGTTSVDSTIEINEDTRAKPDSSGHFLVRYTLPVGETTITVQVTNRFGRSSIIEIPVTIVSQ